MKKLFLILFILIPMVVFSQKDRIDESLEYLDKVEINLYSNIESFMKSPEKHANTIKVYDEIESLNDFCKKQLSVKNTLSSSMLSNNKVQEYFNRINDIQTLTTTYIELLRPLAGYNSGGLAQNQMSFLDQMFRQFGWKITMLDISCKDAYFYEYQLNGCKMMFIRNTLPQPDYSNNIFNDINVEYTYNNKSKGLYCVRGGFYRLIQFTDDTQNRYSVVIKASSERR